MDTSSGSAGRRSAWSAHWPVIGLLLTGVVVGLWLGNDYGESLDEAANAGSGAQALLAYSGSGDYFSLPSLADHGPIYFMTFVSTSRALHALVPSWSLSDGRHLTNYLMFLAGVLSFYFICLRFMPRSYAGMTTILFATQPLLFGHAFINQKDIPFLTLFLATLSVGLTWLDRTPTGTLALSGSLGVERQKTVPIKWETIRAEWRSLRAGRRRWLVALCIFGSVLALDMVIVRSIEHAGRGLVIAAFNAKAPIPIQNLFDWIATDAYKTPVELYLAKYDSVVIILRQTLAPVLILAVLIALSTALPSFAELWGFSRRGILQCSMLAAGMLLGALISVRQIGVFAGGLITLGLLFRARLKALFFLVVYWLVAACVTVATWPYLWPDPVGRFIQSVLRVGSFPTHDVLFRGSVLSSANLPWTYFPTLAGLELTEPAVILVLIGSFALVWRRFIARRGALRVEDGILGLWGAIPLIGLLFVGVSVYGNIRQLLFVLPPFFVLAGKGLEAVGSALRFKASTILLTALVALPGIGGIVALHPYEYAYFNAIAGGVGGADGEYQLDPWCISYREAAEAASALAEANATVLAIPQSNQVRPYLRPDLNLVAGRSNVSIADVVVTCTYRDAEGWVTGDFSLVYQVERGGAVFAKVWKRVGSQ